MTLKAEDSRFESIPEKSRDQGARHNAKSYDCQAPGKPIGIHAGIEPAKVNEDAYVRHVEPIADFAVVG